MFRGLLAVVTLAVMAVPAGATCGERGGPGCRLPNGKCASWAQADYCRTHPEAAEAPDPGIATGQNMNPNLKRALVALPGSAGGVFVQLAPAEIEALDAWIARQPDPKPSRPEAARRMIDATIGQ
jgi:hypothetical protein